jgi:F0F1-type ATP synthase assembly protein I
MKQTAHIYVLISTLLLVAIAALVFYNASYPVVFYTVLGGQAFWLFTVYKVITDDYTTDKTFDDWYEDNPIERD